MTAAVKLELPPGAMVMVVGATVTVAAGPGATSTVALPETPPAVATTASVKVPDVVPAVNLPTLSMLPPVAALQVKLAATGLLPES